MAPEPPSPSASSTFLPLLGGRARRGSLTSLSSTAKGEIDKDLLSQALDDIHQTASRSDALTSFHDYDGGAPKSGAKEIVSSGISGLYDRYIRGISSDTTPVKDSKIRPLKSASKESIDEPPFQSTVSLNSAGPLTKIQAADAASVKSVASITPSPVVKGFPAGTNAQPEAKAAVAKSPTSKKDAADATRNDIPLTIDTNVREKREPVSKRVRTSEETPAQLDRNRGRDSTVENDRGDTAAESLARVLSQHETPIKDDPKKPRSLHVRNENGLPVVDESDTARNNLRSPSAPPPTAISDVHLKFEDPDLSKYERSSHPDALRPVLSRTGVSHLPGYEPSRASSTDGDAASFTSSQAAPKRIPEVAPDLNSALQRKRAGGHHPTNQSQIVDQVPHHLKRRVISKAFWMKDENAKDCFYCGQAFSTFRRKHHCRTCGQIFDAKCTVLVPGKPFGQPGTIRLCKPCEGMVYGSDDDSSVFSDDASEFRRTPMNRRMTGGDEEPLPEMDGINDEDDDDIAEVATPSIGIAALRRNREAKRRSAVIEFDAPPPLARPTSSHSLISLARRPRSSSHRRQHSRQQNLRSLRGLGDERVPFQPGSVNERDKSSILSAFHNDNIIDPDLAPFLSDEGSDDDGQPDIFTTMSGVSNASPADRERMGLGMFAAASRKGRARHNTSSTAKGLKEDDPLSQATKHLPKLSRSLNPSLANTSIGRDSPRRRRSNMFLVQPEESNSMERGNEAAFGVSVSAGTKLVRSSSMQGRDAPAVELNNVSLDHLRKLLAQLMKDNNIESRVAWEKALIPILLQCTDEVEPNVQMGDDMDIRHYIKLKKVPGGRPGDTSYVPGVVFSKNIALKSMARSISRPRIAIVTFAIEYARHQAHFMSLEPVIAQEQEYLRNLVGRISALRPNVLLVQRNVSGAALHLLDKAGITVAFNIKESVLAAVARVTETTMIKSVDKLAINPSHLGQCDSFEIKTYVHEGKRKSYIFLSGCPPDLGCTVVLRGADTKTLRKIKRITEFMCYVTYNLKLETNLLRDEFVSIPSQTEAQIAIPSSAQVRSAQHGDTADNADSQQVNGTHPTSRYEELEEQSRSKLLSASPFVVFMEPYMLTRLRESERRLATLKTLRDQYAAADQASEGDEKPSEDHFRIVKPEMVNVPASKDQSKAMRDYLHAVHEAQFEKVAHTYETQKRLMESFMNVSSDPFDPLSHQTIVVLQSTVSTINSAPCVGPELLGIGFYAGFNRVQPQFEEDCTLGQYIEDQCLSANSTCKECGKKMIDHHRQYVHGHGQLSISVQRQSAKMRGYQKTILMWATCRICKQETTVTPMSENTWKYSFAKYLELSFWSTALHPRAGGCEHDIHKDFLRCFGFEELVVCVQYDPIEIYDVVVPRTTITWKTESDLRVKNEQFSRFVVRLNAFTESIKKRLDSINIDTLDEKKSIEAHEMLDELRQRAHDDHKELLQNLQRKYAESRYYETIPLNGALRFMDEKAIEWDEIFSDFERDYFPSETDIRKLATLQLRNMFLESQPPPSVISSDASDDEEVPHTSPAVPRLWTRGLTEPALHYDKAHDVLSSTLEEHRNSMVDLDSKVKAIGEDAEDSNGSDIVKKISPREEQEQAVQREDVKHLDLAVPSMSPDDVSEELRSADDSSRPNSRPQSNDSQSNEEPFATQGKTMGSGLMERIEQIRSTRTSSVVDSEMVASKIPRLANLRRRDTSPKLQPPPMIRAQSSPSSPRHVRHRSGEPASEQSIDAIANGATTQETQPLEKGFSERLGVSRLANKVGKVAPSLIPRSIPLKTEDVISTKVSALAKHFEQMSREFEKERLKERRQRALRSRQARRANPLASSEPVVEVYRNATDAVGERAVNVTKPEQIQKESETDRSSTAETPPTIRPAGSDETNADHQQAESQHLRPEDANRVNPDADHDDGEDSDLERPGIQSRDFSGPALSPPPSGLASPISDDDIELIPEITIPEHKKSVWFKYLAEFWSKRTASGWTNLEYPLRSTEHVFEDSDIIVREDEPSSVIALSLACTDYQTKTQQFRSHPKKQAKQSGRSDLQTANGTVQDSVQKAIEASLLSDIGTHMKYSFAHGQVKASCKIFYAEAFDALRRKCGVADRFVESLSRCLKFDSKGGKTKSIFLKTLDNRFYIKSLQEVELKAFTKFAPDYFAFMSHTLFHGVPSVIAKMFGLFQVIIKNPATGVDFSYYLLVMENLFYGRAPNRRFDLKGSMRNRKIESTGQPDEVLLDENLVETIFESPLFVREHARRLLQASVWNDTMWLCKQNVMDYSLMAGFDDTGKELIVGIIDCIRTYTWDKKLESWIKDRGKNKPTITSPKDYRNRFRVSMMQYVLQAPSPWSRFSGEMEIAGRLPPERFPQDRPGQDNDRPPGSTGKSTEGQEMQKEQKKRPDIKTEVE